MKKILIIAGAVALLLNSEIIALAVLNIAGAWAVYALFRAMADRGEERSFNHARNKINKKIL